MSAVRQRNTAPVIERSVESLPDVSRRSVRKQAKRQIRLEAILICASCCLVLSLGLVAQKGQLVIKGRELESLREELDWEKRMHDHLQLQLMQARSPQEIDRLARERLGLRRPESFEYVSLPSVVSDVAEQRQMASVTLGPLAGIARWLTDNWPRWGQVEARHLLD